MEEYAFFTGIDELEIYGSTQSRLIYSDIGAKRMLGRQVPVGSKLVVPIIGYQTGYNSGKGFFNDVLNYENTYLMYGVADFEGRVMPLASGKGELIPWRGLVTVYNTGAFKAQLEISGTDFNPNSLKVGARITSEKMIYKSFNHSVPSISIETNTGIRAKAHKPFGFAGLLLVH